MSRKRTAQPDTIVIRKMARRLKAVDPDNTRERRSALFAAGFTDAQISQLYSAASALARSLTAQEINTRYPTQFGRPHEKFTKR